MARTVAQIQRSILDSFAANPNLVYTDTNGIIKPITDNTSMYAIFNAFAYCVAVAQAVLEQLMDLYVTTIETIVNRSAAASAQWIQAKMFQFQYSVSNPQIVQLVGGIPQYPTVDDTLKIISACSVGVDITNTVNVKCATGTPLAALDTNQKAAAQSYINLIGVDGIAYSLVSLDPDRIYIAATVYYNGMYSSTMLQTITDTVSNYFQQLSVTRFDGSLLMSDIENLIRNITGVNDVVLTAVKGRPNTTSYPGGIQLISNSQTLQRAYSSKAGYVVPEDASGGTLADTITLIAQ